jgi:DNA-binding Xre family transcriptional regulator
MSVSYKPLKHLLIEREMSNAELMRKAAISANIISKIKSGQYIALEKIESICSALECTPNDIMVFVPDRSDDPNIERNNK